jgi:hypothetical protein
MLEATNQAIKQSRVPGLGAGGLSYLNQARVITIRQLDEQRSVVLAPSGKETKNLIAVGTSSYVKALARLRYLSQYTNRWDGPGTRAASKDSFRLATDFLGLLSRLGMLFRVDAMIYAPGTAALSVISDDVDARLEFLPNGTIAANIDSTHAQIDADIFGFDGKSIPNELAILLVPPRQQRTA